MQSARLQVHQHLGNTQPPSGRPAGRHRLPDPTSSVAGRGSSAAFQRAVDTDITRMATQATAATTQGLAENLRKPPRLVTVVLSWPSITASYTAYIASHQILYKPYLRAVGLLGILHIYFGRITSFRPAVDNNIATTHAPPVSFVSGLQSGDLSLMHMSGLKGSCHWGGKSPNNGLPSSAK